MLKKCGLCVAFLALVLGVAMKIGMAQFTRFTVVGSSPPPMDEAGLARLTQGSVSLCVGCTAGIGEGIAKELCTRGGQVVVIGRRKPGALMAVCPGTLEWVQADLSSMKTALATGRKLAPRKFQNVLFTLDYISPSGKQMRSDEGIEMNTAVYFLSRFVMIQELLAAGLGGSDSRKPRVFSVAFPGVPDTPQLEDFNWEGKVAWESWKAHKNAVVSQDAVVLGLAKRHPDVNFYGLNPGIIKTDILKDLLGAGLLHQLQQIWIGAIGRTVQDYSLNTCLQLLVSPQLESMTGTFYNHYGERIKPAQWLTEPGEQLRISKERVEQIWQEASKLAIQALK